MATKLNESGSLRKIEDRCHYRNRLFAKLASDAFISYTRLQGLWVSI